MSLTQQQPECSGFADATSNTQWNFGIDDCLVIGQAVQA
jgi:hypothetical protein